MAECSDCDLKLKRPGQHYGPVILCARHASVEALEIELDAARRLWHDERKGHETAREALEREVAQLKRVRTKRFPLQGGPSVPWEAIEPHEQQVKRNHYQSLEELAERGGLSCCEFYFVMMDSEYVFNHPDAIRLGREMANEINQRYEWLAEQNRALVEALLEAVYFTNKTAPEYEAKFPQYKAESDEWFRAPSDVPDPWVKRAEAALRQAGVVSDEG